MARFLYWSDLHCEFWPFQVPKRDDGLGIDAILIAGDIDVKGKHIDLMTSVWDEWRVPVLAVAGNHEPYGSRRFQKHLAEEQERLAAKQRRGIDIDVLRCGERVIGDTRIIGATLWTDMRLFPDLVEYIELTIREKMNDYRAIQWHDAARDIYRKLHPMDTVAMHHAERRYIESRLGEPFSGKTVVMTHHLPIAELLPFKRRSSRFPVSAAYASDLWGVWQEYPIDAWIYGHSHEPQDRSMPGKFGPVRFVSNMRGYPHDQCVLEPLKVLEV